MCFSASFFSHSKKPADLAESLPGKICSGYSPIDNNYVFSVLLPYAQIMHASVVAFTIPVSI